MPTLVAWAIPGQSCCLECTRSFGAQVLTDRVAHGTCWAPLSVTVAPFPVVPRSEAPCGSVRGISSEASARREIVRKGLHSIDDAKLLSELLIPAQLARVSGR